MVSRLPRLMLAASGSGSGKTTAMCAVLRAFANRGTRVAAFKCGPDYIDPMFHRESVGAADSANLDLFFSEENTVRRLLAEREHTAELALIEGVMGFYDGIACTTQASSYELARATDTPVVLVVNCKGMAATIAAQVSGLCGFRPDSGIQAVLFNNLPPTLYPALKQLVEQECGVKSAGFLPPMKDCSLESRHLGLVTAAEVQNLGEKLDRLAAQAAETVDLALLMQIAQDAPPLVYQPQTLAVCAEKPRIAVAKDEAFCFYYADTLSLLARLGAKIVFFSPLRDHALPEGAQGLLLGGGYPELYARALSENLPMRRAVLDAVTSGMPTVAECGGFLYLHRTLADPDNIPWPMVGAIDAEGFATGRLGRFGYVHLTAQIDGLLCDQGGTMPAHEFHYWDSTAPGEAFAAKKPARDTRWSCGYASPSLYAGFAHLYFPGIPDAAARFVAAAAKRGR